MHIVYIMCAVEKRWLPRYICMCAVEEAVATAPPLAHSDMHARNAFSAEQVRDLRQADRWGM